MSWSAGRWRGRSTHPSLRVSAPAIESDDDHLPANLPTLSLIINRDFCCSSRQTPPENAGDLSTCDIVCYIFLLCPALLQPRNRREISTANRRVLEQNWYRLDLVTSDTDQVMNCERLTRGKVIVGNDQSASGALLPCLLELKGCNPGPRCRK